jgi:hypothetical protein
VSSVRIKHRESGTLLADGPLGWGITPFEGNYYIRKKYLKTDGFRPNYFPGLCIYKFLYVWMLSTSRPGSDCHLPTLLQPAGIYFSFSLHDIDFLTFSMSAGFFVMAGFSYQQFRNACLTC